MVDEDIERMDACQNRDLWRFPMAFQPNPHFQQGNIMFKTFPGVPVRIGWTDFLAKQAQVI